MVPYYQKMIVSAATLVLLCSCQVSGLVRVPRWVSDNMVLQTNAEYGSRSFINGMADPGEMVSVTIGKAAFPATADANGEWEIEANHASGTVTATGDKGDTITADNAASGDVFFCAGQSNMVFPLGLAFNFTDEAATLTTYPNFRFFMTALDYSSEPQFDLKPDPTECDAHNTSLCAMSCAEPGMCNRWVTAQEALANNASYLSKFSAVCFMTARDIARMHTSSRPIGLVFSAWGGTRVEAWMSTAAIADASVRVVPGETYLPTTQPKQNNVSVLYNAMVAPFNKLSIRAALWYQGEANCASALDASVLTDYYAEYLQAMVRDWRDLKRMGDFAFMPMMLPPSVPSDTPPDKQLTTGRPAVRLAEIRVAPHSLGETDISGVPVTVDLGGASAWGFDHPPNKNEMSRRLALQTVHAAYALQGRIPRAWGSGGDSLWTGPILSNITMSTSMSSRVGGGVGGGDDGVVGGGRGGRGGGGSGAMTTVTIAFEAFTAVSLALNDVHALNINGSANDCVRCCAGAQPFELMISGEWVRPNRQAITMSSKATVAITTTATPASVSAVRYAWSDYVDCILVNNDSLSLAPFVHSIAPHFNPITTTPTSLTPKKKSAGVVDTTLFTRRDTPIQSPPMGFNSWNFYHCNIDENIVRSMADRFVSSGMAAVNYSYINIDDCWQVARDANGRIIEDPVRFPSGIKALTDYVHSQGLKFGLYTARGSGTCQGRPGSLNYELIDAATYCEWGIDYIKIDACRGAQDSLTSWSRFHQGLSKCYNDTGKFIVQSVESCDDPSTCGQFVTTVANLWRTGGDVQNYWGSIMNNIHKNDIMKNVAVPGHFNDPDMLQVGNVGLTPDEQRTHFSLWCIVGAPLLAGTDIIHASNKTLEILIAPEVIAVNQDLGRDGQIQGIYLGAAAGPTTTEVVTDVDVEVDVDVDGDGDEGRVAVCDSSTKQQWQIVRKGGVPLARGSTPPINEPVQLRQTSSGGLLSVPNCVRAPLPHGVGPSLEVTTSNTSACMGNDKLWEFHTNGTITSMIDGQCINVAFDRNPLQTFDCATMGKQSNGQFTYTKQGAITVTMNNKRQCVTTGAPSPSPPPPSPQGGASELWAKPLSDGRVAIVLVNTNATASADLTVAWSQLNITGVQDVRDLRQRKDLGSFEQNYTAKAVPAHGSVVLAFSNK